MKKYDNYKNSGVDWLGEIPEHWEVKRFKHITNIQKGKLPKKIVSINELNLPPYMSMEYLRGGEENQWVFDKDAKIIDQNKTLLLWDGSNAGEFIKSRKGVISSTVAEIEFKNIEENFAWFYSKFLEIELRKKTIGMGIPHVNGTELKNFSVAIPPFQEQTAIANFLDDKTAKIDQAIAIKQQQIGLLQERRQILIHKAVTRGLNENVKLKDSGVEWIGEIPEHWKLLKINYFSKVGNGSTPSRENMKFWKEGKFPWLNSSSVNREIIIDNNQFVTKRALKECHLPILEKGTILIAITGEGKTRGKAAICEIEATINQHLAYIKVDPKIAFNYFIMYVFHSMYDKLRADSSSQGSTKGALTCEAIKQIKLPIPSIPEQEEIAKFIEIATTKIATAISLKEQEIEKLKEYKMSLIDGVVTGKVKVS